MTVPVELPRQLWRVVWDQGFGFPTCTRRERTQRTFPTPALAVRQIEAILAWPSHHRLVGVYMTAPLEWHPIEACDLIAEMEESQWEAEQQQVATT